MDACTRCGRHGYCFCRGGPPGHVDKRSPFPPPLQRGVLPGAQPCRTCNQPAWYEWTFTRFQACSQACLARQGCVGEDLRRAVLASRS